MITAIFSVLEICVKLIELGENMFRLSGWIIAHCEKKS